MIIDNWSSVTSYPKNWYNDDKALKFYLPFDEYYYYNIGSDDWIETTFKDVNEFKELMKENIYTFKDNDSHNDKEIQLATILCLYLNYSKEDAKNKTIYEIFKEYDERK